jgi:hypothetical protein
MLPNRVICIQIQNHVEIVSEVYKSGDLKFSRYALFLKSETTIFLAVEIVNQIRPERDAVSDA